MNFPMLLNSIPCHQEEPPGNLRPGPNREALGDWYKILLPDYLKYAALASVAPEAQRPSSCSIPDSKRAKGVQNWGYVALPPAP